MNRCQVITRVETDPRWANRKADVVESDGTYADALMKSAVGLAKYLSPR